MKAILIIVGGEDSSVLVRMAATLEQAGVDEVIDALSKAAREADVREKSIVLED